MSIPFISLNYQDSEIRERLIRLQAKSNDLSQPLNEIGQYLLASADKGFENELDPYGIPWLPNSPSIKRYKQSKGLILKVLQATGRMRASISYRVANNSVIVGTNVGYAYKHQVGEGVPKREFLGISDRNKQDIISILDEYLTT